MRTVSADELQNIGRYLIGRNRHFFAVKVDEDGIHVNVTHRRHQWSEVCLAPKLKASRVSEYLSRRCYNLVASSCVRCLIGKASFLGKNTSIRQRQKKFFESRRAIKFIIHWCPRLFISTRLKAELQTQTHQDEADFCGSGLEMLACSMSALRSQ